MGHVDHGKTTLLDYIQKTAVASREAGGITQAIGAYEIVWPPRNEADVTRENAEKIQRDSASSQRSSAENNSSANGRKITFIDTPGHEAFSNMRAYGAQVADIAILVVAADDGVKPQTKEALQAILDSKTPFVVAINKIDKNNADIERAKRDLKAAGVALEGEGGNISWQQISAKTGEGVDDLMDLVLLVAEVEELTYDPQAPAAGVILTSRLDPRRGITAGAILKNGTLARGALIATRSAKGKIKFLEDHSGTTVNSLVPSAPALIIGFEALPQVGEEFCAGTEADIEAFLRNSKHESKKENGSSEEAPAENAIRLILKADEMASLEALKTTIEHLKLPAAPRFIDVSVGNITERDVKLAGSTRALIVGFKTKVDKAAENIAKSQHTLVIDSPIIYELGKKIQDYAKKLIPKEIRRIEILAVFGEAKGKERVVGGRVVLGPIKNQEPFEIWQDEKQIGEGKIVNLQSQRKDIQSADTDTEVGLLVQTNDPIKPGNFLLFSDDD